MNKHIIIIGGGPAGFPAAVTAAKNGAAVSLIEREKIGGVCLHSGCIPARSVFSLPDINSQMPGLLNQPLSAGRNNMTWRNIQKHKRDVMSVSYKGMLDILEKMNVNVINGTADLINENSVEIMSENSRSSMSGDAVILATGAKAVFPGVISGNKQNIISAEDFFDLSALPSRVAIIGGGVIGTEFASSLKNYGIDVSLFERQNSILSGLDEEITGPLEAYLKKQGVLIHTGVKLSGIKEKGRFVTVSTQCGKKYLADKVVIAAGRMANMENAGIKKIGIESENGNIKINSRLQTNVSSIYAAGDLVNLRKFSSLARHQGRQLGELLTGAEKEIDPVYKIPYTIFSQPPVSAVGYTSGDLIKNNILYKERIYFAGKKVMMRIRKQEIGVIKVFTDKSFSKILGAQAAGLWAPQIINTITTGMYHGISPGALKHTPVPYPGFEEILESALAF